MEADGLEFRKEIRKTQKVKNVEVDYFLSMKNKESEVHYQRELHQKAW